MSEIKVNKISPRAACGTVTLGDSGDTFTIPSGATITNNGTANGFGADGAVNWQTSIKTTTFTAANQEGYFVDTSSGAVTANLPAGTAGNIVAFADYARNFGTHNLTITPNGSQKIGGQASSAKLNVDGQASTFVYADDTNGWINVQNAEDTESGASFIAATGGNTVATCGNFKIHTFTSPGTFCVSAVGNAAGSNTVSYMVVAGGGGTDRGNPGSIGGGGGGGFREGLGINDSYTGSPLRATTGVPVTATGFPITVGAGGTGGSPCTPTSAATNGSNSIFSSITSAGGGKGNVGSPGPGAGGSGGGGPTNLGPLNTPTFVGAGNTPPVTPPQGNPGGFGLSTCGPGVPYVYRGGGGGGATAAGTAASPPAGGAGGAGATTSINGSPNSFSGGGGGASGKEPAGSDIPAGAGGTGGGGAGGARANGTAGTVNTGGGAGGAGYGPGGTIRSGAAGGSGIVIIRYKFQ